MKIFIPLLALQLASFFCLSAKTTINHYDDSIVVCPEGLESQFYNALGDFRYGDDLFYRADADYYVEIAFDGDDVYMKGFLTGASDAWLKGERSGNEITFLSGQYLGQTVPYGENQLKDAWLLVKPMPTNQAFTLTIDEEAGTLTMNDTYYPHMVVGSGKQRVEQYKDIQLTRCSVQPNIGVPVRLPEGIETWTVDLGISVDGHLGNTYSHYDREMAIDGNDLYVKGIISEAPDAWVKGTISSDDDRKVRLPLNQYLCIARKVEQTGVGTNSMTSRPIWFSAGTFSSSDSYTDETIEFDWNPETKTLSFNLSESLPYFYCAYSDIGIWEYVTYMEAKPKQMPASIQTVSTGSEDTHSVYSLDGRGTNSLQHGLNIVVRNDGQTAKVWKR